MVAIMQHLGYSSPFYVHGLTPIVIIISVKSIRKQTDAVLNIV
jgi:hypothetical protein